MKRICSGIWQIRAGYGLYYGITGPLSLGHSIIMDERSFNVIRQLS
jgi:hypothetical protein